MEPDPAAESSAGEHTDFPGDLSSPETQEIPRHEFIDEAAISSAEEELSDEDVPMHSQSWTEPGPAVLDSGDDSEAPISMAYGQGREYDEHHSMAAGDSDVPIYQMGRA